MKITSPPFEQKMEFHRLRGEGKFPGGHEGWLLYQKWRNRPKSNPDPQPEEPAPVVDTVSIDDYEPDKTPQEELGF